MTDDNSNRRTGPDRAGSQRELRDALERLEHAVEDLAVTAKDEWADWADRATAFIDDTSARLEREVSSRRDRAKRKAKEQPVVASDFSPRSTGLARDSANGKIAGVCAGLARYWDMETWMVRCIAITGLLFIPGVVFPAYFVAWLVLSDSRDGVARRRRRRGRHSRDREDVVAAAEFEPPPPREPLPPRTQFRNVQSVLSQAELRLRRMETHVTSGQYELQKELHALDTEPNIKPVT